MYFENLREAMQVRGDTQQDLATILGLRSFVSVNKRLAKKTKWKDYEIKLICKRYKKTKEELGF